MKQKTLRNSPPAPHVAINKDVIAELLSRLGDGPADSALATPSESGEALSTLGARPPVPQTSAPTTEERWNAALGCKTSEVALGLLSQVVALENQNLENASDERIDQVLARATAMLAELQPTTATEALLAAQMVGVQRTAMMFLAQATRNGLTVEGVNGFVLQATRLMRLFTEQVETMAKLKGKGGQQRVVVEHVTVGAGGQAIVGTVIPGGRGTSGDDRR